MTEGLAILPLLAAVLVASLLGSGHCVGMCGAFVALAVTGDGAPSRHRLAIAYHVGRLASYTTLGAIAGSFGAAFEMGGAAVGVQRGAIVVAGAMMVLFAIVMLLRLAGVAPPRLPLPERLTASARSALTTLHRLAWTLRPLPRAGTIGLLTPLLPCGWLYAFVITAAGTAHPLTGAATMAVFWCGTVPALAIVGLGAKWIADHGLGRFRRHLPFLTALLLGAVGLWMLIVPAALPAVAAGGAQAPTSIDEAVTRVRDFDQSTLPCCRDD